MGLPDQAKAKPVSSLRAFFEQQGGSAFVKPEQKDTGPSLGGNGFKTRVRSNFIPVGKAGDDTQSKPEELSTGKAGDITVLENVDEAPKKEDVPVIEKANPVKEKEEEKEREEDQTIGLPPVEKTNGATELAKTASPETPARSSLKDGSKSAAPVEPVKVEQVVHTTIAAVKDPKPVPTVANPPRTPTQLPLHKTPPTKAVPPSARVASTPKRPAELTRTPKSPPTPKQTPPSTHPSNAHQRKPIGPLSPAKSSTSRSSSPFLASPTRFSRPTPKKETPVAKAAPKVSPSTDRKVSTPKSVTTPAKTAMLPTKPVVKVSPAPKKAAVTPKTATPTPRGPSIRPRSAQSDVATPSPSRRIVSHPPRPATATSRPSPKLNRATSMQHLPRKPKAEHPPVPPIPEQDYSHLPTFMRPTQASSAKVVARPSSAMEKRSFSGSFKA